jgi:choline-sulfatase
MTDQQRHDQVGYASGGFFETPALDALAAGGVVFRNAYSAAATCVPARIGLLTGVQPRRLPLRDDPVALRPGVWTVARALRAAGYETALIGKMHFTPIHADHGFETMRTSEHLGATRLGLRPDGTPDLDDYHQWLVDAGVATWKPFVVGAAMDVEPVRPPDSGAAPFPFRVEYSATTWVENQVRAFLAARTSDRPLFLVVSFPHPHTPLNPLGPYRSRYAEEDAEIPVPGFEVNDGLPASFRAAIDADHGVYRPWRVPDHGVPALRARVAKVRALVRQIDDALGRLLPLFPLDRTLVAFTSDHGDYAGRRGLAGKVPWIPFDDLVRVPLVIAGAGVATGGEVDALVQSCDLPLTFCTAGGAELPEPPEEFDSYALDPFLARDTDGAPRDRAVLFLYNAGWPGARLGTMKLIRHRQTGEPVLFDLAEDPDESVNRAGDPRYRDAFASLTAVVDAGLERPPPPRIAQWADRSA